MDISLFEVIMLVCFGVSWPISIIKTLRTKIAIGKSPLFMIIVATGYASGIVHKLLYSRDPVIFLYILNMCMVLFDLYLYYHYAHEWSAFMDTIVPSDAETHNAASDDL